MMLQKQNGYKTVDINNVPFNTNRKQQIGSHMQTSEVSSQFDAM